MSEQPYVDDRPSGRYETSPDRLTQPWSAEQVAELQAVRDAVQRNQTEQDGERP